MIKLPLHGRGKQTLVYANVYDTRVVLDPFDEPLIERVHDFLIIKAVWMLG